jgi:GntR family transcriptional regulator, histidine utilization repressor
MKAKSRRPAQDPATARPRASARARVAAPGPAGRGAPSHRYQQLKQMILDRIASGEWGEGTRLPSEHEFVEQYGLSRMTIHRALRELSEQGVLSRHQGIGTFVLPPAPRSELLAIRDIAEDIVRRGNEHSCKVLVLDEVRADIELATSFGKTVGARLFHSVLVHHEDATAVQLEERYVNPTFAPDYLSVDFSSITPAKYLHHLGPATEVEHIIFAGLADARHRKGLRIRAEEPCLFLMRRTWLGDVQATHSLFVYPARRYSLGSRYRLTGTGAPTLPI